MLILSFQDEVDKETIHLLVFLFMQFLSNADQAVIPGKSHMKGGSISEKI
jgi:hypothetical protein